MRSETQYKCTRQKYQDDKTCKKPRKKKIKTTQFRAEQKGSLEGGNLEENPQTPKPNKQKVNNEQTKK